MNFAYHAAMLQGRLLRTMYRNSVARIARRPIKQPLALPALVYAFSCHHDLPEQVASLRSFLTQVGIPQQFTVVSDGTYNSEDIDILCSIHPCVAVVEWRELVSPELPHAVRRYASQHPLGKKLAMILSLPVTEATIVLDSDVLFFPNAKGLLALVTCDETQAFYLLDAAPALDRRMLYHDTEANDPVNSGFILFKHRLDWTGAIKRLENLVGEPKRFTEQTVIHVAMHHNQAKPFCSNKYVVGLDDQVFYTDWYVDKDIALRHYVNPVRHKMWARLPG